MYQEAEPRLGLKEILRGKGIEIILFDFDDTLICTRETFISHMADFYQAVVSMHPEISLEEIKKKTEETNNRNFFKYGVNPTRWQHVIEELTVEYGNSHRLAILEAYTHLQAIYSDPPVIKEGVIETLETLKAEDIRLGLVTHANEAWTNFKLETTGLGKYFKQTIVISEDGHKTAEEWGKAIEIFSVKPENVLVIGDNVKGDIQAAHEAGAKHLIWFDEGDGWSLYRQGELPPETKVIHKIPELFSTLINI